jgi:23S rRNA G2445 N2-methylase RlmL
MQPFEHWPIHRREEYMQFKEDLNEVQKMRKRHEIDIQLIGSDIAQRAVETTIKNVDYADIQSLCEADLILPR